MNIRELKLWGYGPCHKDTKLVFPERGVVVLTGSNGSGKSSIPEAAAYALFGETLRGTLPFTDGGGALVGADTVVVERSRYGSKTKLGWKAGASATVYETVSKAQEALETVIGNFDLWRRSHVFSSADTAALFSLATDKERKLFLESMLGLSRFDAALERCRADLHNAERAVVSADGQLKGAQALVEANQTRQLDARKMLASLPSSSGEDAGKLKALREQIRKAEKELTGLRREISAAAADTGGAQRELSLLNARLLRLESGVCDACTQDVPEALRGKLREKADALKGMILDTHKSATETRAEIQTEVEDVEATLERLREREQKLALGEQTVSARSEAESALKSAEAGVKKGMLDVVGAEGRLQDAREEFVLLKATELVLGLRGVRASILGRLLGSLAESANAWLYKLSGAALRLELKPYSERKDGGVSDAISLQVIGAGGGQYKGSSGGQRRRIDLALLLSFAGKGTLFFDEALDALDNEGLEAAATVMEELAKERAVLVITHRPEVIRRLPAAVHWHMEAGQVKVLPR